MEINERIKILRNSLSLSQEEFGKRLGLSKSGISNIESQTRGVREAHILLISSSFGVSERWLRTGEGNMFKDALQDDFKDYFDIPESIPGSAFDEFSSDDIRAATKIVNDLAKLNNLGKSKAADQVELLTKIPEYKKEN